MPYSVEVTVIDLGSTGAFPNPACRLWEMWTEVGGPAAVERESEYDRVDLTPTSVTFTVNFPVRGPGPGLASRSIGISLQDATRVGTDSGWWFRSGRYDTLPGEPIEIILAGPEEIASADLTSGVTLPVSSGPETINTIALTPGTPAGAIGFTATGTTTRVPGSTFAFTYTSTLNVVPSPVITDPASSVVQVGLAPGSLTFTAGPGQGFVAAILNGLAGLIETRIRPQIHRTINDRINQAAVDQIAMRLLSAPPPNPDGSPGPKPVLPPSVIPSVRTVAVTPAGVRVLAALGAYGGVVAALRAASPNPIPNPTCPVKMMALAGLVAPMQLAALRQWRDGALSRGGDGARAVTLFRRHAAEVTAVLARHPVLAVEAARVARAAAAGDPGVPEPAVERAGEHVMRKLMRCASPTLRNDIGWALETRPWRASTA